MARNRIKYSVMHFDHYGSFVQPFCVHIQQYRADRDVGNVTLFQEMLGQVPKLYCHQCLTVTKNM